MASAQPDSGESNRNSEQIEEGDDSRSLLPRNPVCLTLREQETLTTTVQSLENAILQPRLRCPHEECHYMVANNNARDLVQHISNTHPNSLRSTVQSLENATLQPELRCPHEECHYVVVNNNARDLVQHISNIHPDSLRSTVQSLGVPCPLADQCHDEAVYNSAEDLANHIRDAHPHRTVLPSFSDLSQSLSLSSLSQSLVDSSPASVGANQDLAPIVSEHSSPLRQGNRDVALPQHSSPLVQPDPNPTAQAPRPYGHYFQDRTVQVREQAQARTQHGDPQITAVQPQHQEQPQGQESDAVRDALEALLLLGVVTTGARELEASGGVPVLEAQPPAGTAPGGQAHNDNMHGSTHSEEQIEPEGQEDAPEAAAQPSEPTIVPDPPFAPCPGDKCSMCLRSLPNPHKNPPKEPEPDFEFQWRAHVDPERNCRIPNKRGSNRNLPDRSGWIGKLAGSRDRVTNARKEYRDPWKELFPNKFYPINDRHANSSLWKYDPNNETNRENWDKPWPPPVEKRLRENAAAEAKGQTEASSVATAGARPRPARRRTRQAPADNAEYRAQSESDSDDDLEPDVDDTRPPKRRRVGDRTYRPVQLSDVDEGDEDAESAAPPENTTARGRRRARASGPRGAATNRRSGRGNRATSTAAAGPAPPPEGLRRSARQRAQGRR